MAPSQKCVATLLPVVDNDMQQITAMSFRSGWGWRTNAHQNGCREKIRRVAIFQKGCLGLPSHGQICVNSVLLMRWLLLRWTRNRSTDMGPASRREDGEDGDEKKEDDDEKDDGDEGGIGGPISGLI